MRGKKKNVTCRVCVDRAFRCGVLPERVFSRGACGGGKKRALPVYSVERSDKKISISFDCAWGVDYTDELLKIMDEYDVKCTFFMVQFWAEKYPEYVKKSPERGMKSARTARRTRK